MHVHHSLPPYVLYLYLVSTVSSTILIKQLTVQGFIVWRWLDEWPEAFKEIREWIKEVGRVKLKYTVAL